MFFDLFQNSRKTEPSFFIWLRRFCIVLLLLLLTAFFVALSIKVAQEAPSMRSTLTLHDAGIPAPGKKNFLNKN